ncbi:MAG: YfhO family protein [Bacilli bacterium]|nr:YfhO family protein [Bacilli bacterium]
MEENVTKTATLREIRSKKPAKEENWFRRHFSFLFHPGSVFYYGVILFLVAFLWAAYPLFTNSYTQLLNWDYTWQYIPFTYVYWDAWHTFFTTGHLPLYDAGVYLGTDMIGSGSYYGLFDPFMFICYLFPRAWIPQMYAQMTFVKIMVGGLGMRAYLKQMGIKEWTARFGGVIYALSGYTVFFMGSPNFITTMAFFPFILLGIEKVIQEQKVVTLSLSVFFLAISCFFYVPVICLYGVIYALWRFFSTLKKRNKTQQIQTMVLGVAGFAIGLLLSCFSFIPSMRETLLTGRSTSIGSAYISAVKTALKSFDFRMVFALVFEEVGDNPGRELMGAISFFFPAGGWTNLPFERGGYDAWTSSLFCYTPGVILFFCALIHSVRLKKWNHLLAVAICFFAIFTNFSYFFFYAFSGNGYGRWYLVLVPLIVYYCCWGFDQRTEGPKFVPFVGALLGLLGTIVTYYLVINLISGKSFTYSVYNVHHTTYWQTTYYTPDIVYNGITSAWYFYYQIALVVVEGVLYCIGQRKKWMPYVFFGFVIVEAIVAGNASYAFNGTWSYQKSFTGGEANRETSLAISRSINGADDSFFRTYSDTCRGSEYFHNVFGFNVPATFHSLMNFDVEPFALTNQMKLPGSTGTTYNDVSFYNPRWSGYYSNKRYAMDSLLGYRYYVIENNYSAWKDVEGNPVFLPANVPFDCVEMTSYSPDRNKYRIYQRSETSLPQLGYAVDSDLIYRLGQVENNYYKNAFFGYYNGSYSFNELEWAQYVETNGAIIDDNVTLPESFGEPKTCPDIHADSALLAKSGIRRLYPGSGLKVDYYQTKSGQGMMPPSAYRAEGLAYFFNHYESVKKDCKQTLSVAKDLGKVVLSPDGKTYFNEDPNGCYFDLHYYNSKSEGAPRVYAIGDTFDENGNMTGENVTLSFDNYVMPNAANTDYYCREACTFGVYAKGRVKHIVLCYGGSGSVSVPTNSIFLSTFERDQIELEEANRLAESLKNVKKGVNTFTFDTAYDTDRIVVTQLGYDKGWGVKATMPDGSKKDCQMLRLNGGLVGFVAPSALDENGKAKTIHCVMEYKTPYSNLSVAAFVGGTLCLAGIVGTQFYFSYKKKKEQDRFDLLHE